MAQTPESPGSRQKRECVIIVRERDGKSVPAVFRTEGAALSWIKKRIQPGTVVNADLPEFAL